MKKNPLLVVRIFVLTILFLSLIGIDAYAEQKQIKMKYSHHLPEAMSVAKQARFFEKIVKEKSKGNVLIEVYPAAQLFGARDAFQALRKGGIEMATVVIGSMEGAIPLTQIFDVPFLFKDYDQVVKSWNGYLGEVLKKEFEKLGVKFLAPGYLDFAHICNSKREIKTPKDLQGLKIRTYGPMAGEVLQALGAAPVVMGGDESYLAMSRKVIDGSFTGIITMTTRKYYEIQKYATLLNATYIDLPVMINLKVWESLPKDIQELLQQCADESAEKCLNWAINDGKEFAKTLQEKGMQIYTPTSSEIQEFKKVCAPLRESWIGKQGDVAAKMVKYVESLK